MDKKTLLGLSPLFLVVAFVAFFCYKAEMTNRPDKVCSHLAEVMPKGFESRFTHDDYLGCVQGMKKAQALEEKAFNYFYDCAIVAPGPLEWAACAN